MPADVATGIRIINLLQATAQALSFEGCSVGIDASSGSGMLNLIDSTATNTSVFVAAAELNGAAGSLVLENVLVDDSVPVVSSLVQTPP